MRLILSTNISLFYQHRVILFQHTAAHTLPHRVISQQLHADKKNTTTLSQGSRILFED